MKLTELSELLLKSVGYTTAESTPMSIVSTPETSPVYALNIDEDEVEIEVIEDIQGQPERSIGLQTILNGTLLRLLSCSDDYKTLTFRYGRGNNIVRIDRSNVAHIWGSLGTQIV